MASKFSSQAKLLYQKFWLRCQKYQKVKKKKKERKDMSIFSKSVDVMTAKEQARTCGGCQG